MARESSQQISAYRRRKLRGGITALQTETISDQTTQPHRSKISILDSRHRHQVQDGQMLYLQSFLFSIQANHTRDPFLRKG